MKNPQRHAFLSSTTMRLSVFAIALLVLAGCSLGGMTLEWPFGVPTATFTPTSTSTPTNTPEPTPTPRPGETPLPPTPTPIPTPQVTIPGGWAVTTDADRGYSLALPPGWTELDLRGQQIANMANMVGQGQALADLQAFLATEEGQAIGKVAIQPDMFAMMQGRVPPALNVSVVPLPEGADSAYLMGLVEANMGMIGQFGDVNVDSVTAETVNNLPGIRAVATANLAQVGLADTLFIKAVGLVANNKLYLLTLLSREDQRGSLEPTFDQVIGSFRPE